MASHDAINDSEQTPSLRDANLDPSLAHREVVGAQNRSPSRKRPRLDSGSSRSMSADRTFSSLDKAATSEGDTTMDIDSTVRTPEPEIIAPEKSAATPSKVTINVREAPQQTAASPTNGQAQGARLPPTFANGINGHAKIRTGSMSSSVSPRGEYSPVIEVAELELDTGEDTVAEIHLEEEEPIDIRVASLYHSFPYAVDGGHVEAAELIAEEQNKGLNLEVLIHMDKWIQSLQDCLRGDVGIWTGVFYEHEVFWETVAKIYQRVFARSVLKHSSTGSQNIIESCARTVLHTFANLLARILDIDATFFSTDDPMDIDRVRLLSPKFLHAAKPILRDDKGFLAKVLPSMEIDEHGVRAHFITSFTNSNGPSYLSQMICVNFDEQLKEELFMQRMLSSVEFAQTLGGYAVFYLGRQDGLELPAAELLAQSLVQIFDTVDKQLLCSLEKQQDVLNLEVRRTLFDYQTGLLGAIFNLTPARASERFRRGVGRDAPEISSHYKDVAIMIWKLKLTIAYMTKGRMDMRLQGVDTMAQQLVEFFNAHRDKPQDLRVHDPNALLCFVADFLLTARITEYLFGVASHPQLITRCSNIIGFLVVTNRFSKDQAQLIWRTIKDSPDPRIVNASLPIFANLIRQLSNPEENIMFAEMVLSEELPAMTQTATEFFIELLQRLRGEVANHHYAAVEKDKRFYRIPFALAVEIMRSLTPTRPQLPNTQIVYEHASEVVAAIAPFPAAEVRKTFFQLCVDNIKSSSEDGAPMAQAIMSLLKHSKLPSKDDLQELQLTRVLMEDFCRFVSNMRGSDMRISHQQLNLQLTPRLDLIWQVVPQDDEGTDESLLKRFWSHLVGADALSPTARDVAWHRLTIIAFTMGMDTGFLERHKELLSPIEIDRKFFTPGYFAFMQKRATTQMRLQIGLDIQEDGRINLPGIDLMWDAILQAPKTVADESTLNYLISRYLDPSWPARAPRRSIERTHVALVQDHIERLKLAYRTTRQGRQDTINGIDSGTGIVIPDDDVKEAEMTFTRIIKFLKRFLLHIRSTKDFRPQGTVTIDMTDDEAAFVSRGEALTVKCDIMRPRQANVTRTLSMGTQDTCKQLFTRLCALLGEYNVASFQIITGGKRLYLKEQPRLTLEDAGIARTPHLIVREPINNDEARRDYIIPSAQWRTAFEQELVANLDVLYTFLDGPYEITAPTRDLLKHLPRNEMIAKAISEMTASAADLFPLGQPFKTCYSIDCLRELLESSRVDDEFLQYGSRLLESILPSEEDLSEDTSLSLEIITDTVSCLYDFYFESRSKGLNLFTDAPTVERRLIRICALAISHNRLGSLLWDSFELCIDLMLCSEAVWKEFTKNTYVIDIHERLLLGHPEAAPRRHTAQMLQRKLTQWPDSASTSLRSYATSVWRTVSRFIPRAVHTPQRAAEIFDVALCSYKSLLTLKSLTNEEVTSLFRFWSTLLLEYHHEEFVGRDEPDAVLRGLSSLLFFTVESFPDISASKEKTSLMEHVWWKFLFQKAPSTDTEVVSVAHELPVLETNTRMDLIRLIGSLAADSDTIDMMCSLLGAVDIRQFDRQVDKVGILRSPAGYVGLKNLGQTCYMNSLVTQLFMNPVFRAFILSCAPVTMSKTSPLLHETQRLFAIMQNSFHTSASAADFTKNIVTLTEENIDVREQMDVDEFMNTLFHRWEEQMPSNELKRQLRSVYTGKTVQQIKSKECEHVSEREDTCLAIPCDVQGNSNLEESLRAYVQGDVMEGDNKYKCERCDRLVNAVKRTCLKDIPDHLMLQLKRFAFDLETYSRNKINDHFAFPMSIDMSPYTFKHLTNPDEPMEEDVFDLVGVIVHKGQAEHGHYVSYIRARPTGEEEAPTWLLFDDADVSVLDAKELGEACFGGSANKDSSALFAPTMKSYNAYMLFYQRRSSLQKSPWVPEGSVDLRNVPIAQDMESEVAQDNRALLKDFGLLDESSREYVRCLISKLEGLNHDDSTHALHFKLLTVIWKYLTAVWSRTKEFPEFEESMNALRSVGEKCERCCYATLRWFITSRTEVEYWIEDPLREMLLRINQPKIRGYFRSFILDAMRQIRGNMALYGADITASEPELTGNGAIVIVTRLAQFIPSEIAYNMRAWEDYFGLLADIASLGPQECFALISDRVLTACFDAVLCDSGYGLRADSQHYKELAYALKRKMAPPYNQLIRLASILFGYVDMNATAIDDTDSSTRLDHYTYNGVPWTEYEESILLDFNKKEGGLLWLCEVFQKWNFESDGIPPGEIVQELLHAKSAVVHAVVDTFIISIKDFESRYADPFLRCAKSLAIHLGSRDLLDKFFKMMNECSREANGMSARAEDGYNGAFCHRFWSTVWQVASGHLNARLNERGYFDQQFISYCREWGPVLLVHAGDLEVGRLTHRLLSEALFKVGHRMIDDGIRGQDEQDEAITRLFWGCDRQIRICQSWRESVWQQFLSPAHMIMAECVLYISQEAEQAEPDDHIIVEAERMSSRFEEVRIWYADLPVRNEDGLELAQSSELAAWEGLDIADDTFAEASDLTEISDDDMGSLLTTSLEG